MSDIHEYSNDEITVRWSKSTCKHIGNCVHGSPSVFKPKDRPWVQLEGASTDEIIDTIKTCPSGALTYIDHRPK